MFLFRKRTDPEHVGGGVRARERHPQPVSERRRRELRAEKNADSGLFVRAPQLQVRDYPVAGPYKNLKKYKPQDWNELVVVVKGKTAHCSCNGEVLEESLKLPETGGIGLEADRGQMEYRNIRVKELK